MREGQPPFKALGERLKFLREQWQQSIKEVCGTLEIDESTLRSIEAGKLLPEAELLDMLINHFLLTDDQAEDLRDLAEQTLNGQSIDGLPINFEEMLAKQIVMFMPIDNRIIYTDTMHANVNDHGVILQFMQKMPNTNQPAVVSRVGMSREHAERVIEVLTKTLEQYDQGKHQKFLPPAKPEKTPDQQAEQD